MLKQSTGPVQVVLKRAKRLKSSPRWHEKTINFAFSRIVVKLLGLFFPGFGNFLALHSLVLMAVQKSNLLSWSHILLRQLVSWAFLGLRLSYNNLLFLQPTLQETQAIHTHWVICNNIKSSLGDLNLKLIVAALSAACSSLELWETTFWV